MFQKNIWVSLLVIWAIIPFLVACAAREEEQSMIIQPSPGLTVEPFVDDRHNEQVSPISGTSESSSGISLPTAAATTDSEFSENLERKLIPIARKKLAEHLNIDIDAIQLVTIQAVVWPDASLGCPQSDQIYSKVLTPGFRIVLQYGDQNYSFNTDQKGVVIFCEQGNITELPFIPITPGEIIDGEPWMPVH